MVVLLMVASCSLELTACNSSSKTTVNDTVSGLLVSAVDSNISQGKKHANPSAETSESHPDTFRSGSNVPSKWVYSRDGMVGCRINKWYGYGGTEQNVDFEFINVKSKKPVNIVYRINSIGVKGKVYRLLNFGSDNQVEYTKFIPPLKKGESKIDNIGLKYPSYHSTQAKNLLKIAMKDCRVKRDNENESTLKPEHVKYVEDNPSP